MRFFSLCHFSSEHTANKAYQKLSYSFALLRQSTAYYPSRKPWSGYNQSAQWHPKGPGFLCPPYTFQVPLLQGTVCRNTGVIPVVSANTHKIPVRITSNRAKAVANRINNHRQLKLISTSIHDQAMNRNNISRLPSFLLINARSLLPEIDELSLLLSIYSIEFIAVTETWLKDIAPEQLIYINNYSRGGGVCALISTNIPGKRRMDLENPSHECLWLWLRPHTSSQDTLLD